MKTSKIIFISLLSTITLLILAAAIDLKISGHQREGSGYDFKRSRQSLPAFRVLRVNNSLNITLVRKDSSYLEVASFKDSIVPKVNFALRGDTLVVSDFEKTVHRNVSITICANDSLRKIQLTNSKVGTDRLGMGKLRFELDHSDLFLNQDLKLKNALLSFDIDAKNHSEIDSNEFSVDSLSLQLRNSKANLDLYVKKIYGTLSDSSVIYSRQPQEISLKKDASSKINVYE